MVSEKRLAIEAMYLAGLTMQQCAEHFGCTRQYVSKVIKNAVAHRRVPSWLTLVRHSAEAQRRCLSPMWAEAVKKGGATRRANAWPPEKIETLKDLAARGWSASLIGEEIDKTKNAVIGFCYREGIQLNGTRKVMDLRRRLFGKAA